MRKRLIQIILRVKVIIQDKQFKHFVAKGFLCALPVILAIVYAEHRIATTANSYNQKKFELEKNLDKIQVLVLGSSNAHFGINPHVFSYNGFNLAELAQWPYYDLQLMKKYINRMPHLKLVIFSDAYFTYSTNENVDKNGDWRLFAYFHTYGILPHQRSAFLGWYHPFDPRLLSNIVLYGGQLYTLWTQGSRDLTKGVKEDDGLGWINFGATPCDDPEKRGKAAANEHYALQTDKFLDPNLEYLGKLAKLLQRHHIKMVLVELPQLPSYRNNLDPKKIGLLFSKLDAFAKRYHLKNGNYTNDPRFDAKDFTVLPDHLNGVGATKISKIIDHDLIVPELNKT